MAIELFKIVMHATAPITDVVPAVNRYFYTVPADISDISIELDSNDFFDDTGTQLTGAFTTAAPDNGYYMLYVNGVLQQSGYYDVAVDGTTVTLNNVGEDTIFAESPIVLTVTNFAPTTTAPIITG